MWLLCVHSYLLPDKNRNSKQKTPVAKRSVNPVWNYTFAYDDVSLNELSERALELTIWDHDRLASNEFLGGVRFSLGTGKHAIIHYSLLFSMPTVTLPMAASASVRQCHKMRKRFRNDQPVHILLAILCLWMIYVSVMCEYLHLDFVLNKKLETASSYHRDWPVFDIKWTTWLKITSHLITSYEAMRQLMPCKLKLNLHRTDLNHT